MAYGRDDGNRRRGYRAHHLFLIEGPEILDRPSPASDDQQIGRFGEVGEAAHRRRDLRSGTLPLHCHRPQQHMRGAAILEAM